MKDETARIERADFTVEAMRVLLEVEPKPCVSPTPLTSDERRELVALRCENRRMKMHHELLMNAVSYFEQKEGAACGPDAT